MYYRPYGIRVYLNHEDGACDYMVIPLEEDTLGALYSIKLDLHMDPYYFQDTFMRKHFGIAVANNLPTDNWYLRTTTFYSFKKMLQDTVATVELKFRLQCKARYLLIGVFKKGHYTKELCDLCGISFRVKSFALSKVKAPTSDGNSCIYFCHADSSRHIPDPIVEIGHDSVVINYPLGSDVINDLGLNAIKDFINNLKKDKTLIQIKAFTDMIGSKNYELSTARINRIKKLLVDSFEVDTARLLIENFGEKMATRMKSNDERKVVMNKTYYQLSHLYYEKALTSLKDGDPKSTFKNLSLWLKCVDYDNAILFIFDCRFYKFKENPIYKGLVDKIKKKIYFNSNLVFALDSIYFEDQRYRTLISYIKGNHIYKDSFEISCLYSYNDESAGQIRNEKFIDNLYLKHGFVEEEQVGNRAFHSFIYVILHSSNPEWQSAARLERVFGPSSWGGMLPAIKSASNRKTNLCQLASDEKGK
ncbi:MAG: hypothetical protein IPK46_12980 [Saprospiraceae bacterium]|nr:hypothetical protein [Saprospiraceae bacterium]